MQNPEEQLVINSSVKPFCLSAVSEKSQSTVATPHESQNEVSRDLLEDNNLDDVPHDHEYEMKVADLRDCEHFQDLPDDVTVHVQTGNTFDLKSVQIKKHVPETKQFRIFTFKNPKSKRYIKILKCDHEECGKSFRKWHNFFDHLRIHTNERPYTCPHEGCGFSFTQRANLNKHMEVHGGVKRFGCSHCPRMFYTNFNLKVSKQCLY